MQQGSSRLYLWLAASIAATAGLLFGFDTGNIAGALVFIQAEMDASLFQCEIIVSVTVLAACIGALLSGRPVEIIGRKPMLIIASILFIVGAYLAYLATSIEMLILARAVLGAAIGISSYTAPLYLSEISPANIRGGLVLINGIGITFGEAIAFLLDYAFAANENWRMMLLSGAIPGIVLLCGMSVMPQSPRWLIAKSRLSEAYDVLKKLRGHGVLAEFKAIQQSLEQHSNKPSLWLSQFRWPLMIGLGLGICQQFVGINTIMYYGPYIFKAAGFDLPRQQIFLTFLMGLTNAIMTIVAVLVVDWIGRRRLLLIGTSLSALSLLGATFIFQFGYFNSVFSYLFISLLSLYVVGYCLSVGSLFWLVISEIFPLAIRGRAMSFVASVQWLANFVVSMTFLSLFHSIGPAMTFLMFVSACVFTYWFCLNYIPETKGMTLEGIEALWHPARRRTYRF